MIESNGCKGGWRKRKDTVAKHGHQKYVKQCRNKALALKDTYRKAKDNSNNYGASPNFLQFYNNFNRILGTRNILNLQKVIEVAVSNSYFDELSIKSEDTESNSMSFVIKFASLYK